MEERIHKLESKLYGVESKLNILTAWLKWRFHGDPSFPIYLLQDVSADPFPGQSQSRSPLNYASVPPSNMNEESLASVDSVPLRVKQEQEEENDGDAGEGGSEPPIPYTDPPALTNKEVAVTGSGVVRRYFCQDCGIKFGYRGYRHHCRKYHPEIILPVEERVTRNYWTCPPCQLTFKTKPRYRKHVQRVHNKVKRKASESKVNEKKKVPSAEFCAVCGKVFQGRGRLLAHRIEKHGLDTMRGIKQADMYHLCPICNSGILGAKFTRHMKRCHPGISAKLLNGGKVKVEVDADGSLE